MLDGCSMAAQFDESQCHCRWQTRLAWEELQADFNVNRSMPSLWHTAANAIILNWRLAKSAEQTRSSADKTRKKGQPSGCSHSVKIADDVRGQPSGCSHSVTIADPEDVQAPSSDLVL